MYTHTLEVGNKNLILSAGIYLTNDSGFEVDDAVKVQDKAAKTETNYTVTNVISDAPLCKKDTFVIVLEKEVFTN